MSRPRIVSVLAICMLIPGLVAAATAPAPPSAPASGFRADLLANLAGAESKVEELAAAIPADKWSWRPGAGVRSCSEVVMHIAFANYYLLSFLGAAMPAGVGPEMEKETDQAKALEAVKKSYAYARTVIDGISEADLDTKVKIFGSDTSKRADLLILMGHSHEHLGQLIAYARSNGVVPPWTAREQAAEAKGH